STDLCPVRVALPGQRHPQAHPETGLLLDLSHGRSRCCLAPVELALGEGPVVVRRSVHEQDPALAQHDGTRGPDVAGPGRRGHTASLTPPPGHVTEGSATRTGEVTRTERTCRDDSGSWAPRCSERWPPSSRSWCPAATTGRRSPGRPTTHRP